MLLQVIWGSDIETRRSDKHGVVAPLLLPPRPNIQVDLSAVTAGKVHDRTGQV